MASYMKHVLDTNTIPADEKEKRMEMTKQAREHFQKHPIMFAQPEKYFEKNAEKLKKKLVLR